MLAARVVFRLRAHRVRIFALEACMYRFLRLNGTRFFKTCSLGISLLVLLLGASLAFGQEITGSILGVITDATGAAVPGAAITAASARNPRGVTAVTDNTGNFALYNVPIGSYTITVAKTGFSTLKQS